MAPAAADTILAHLRETKRQTDYYDLIVTGDLGGVGQPYRQRSYVGKGRGYAGKPRRLRRNRLQRDRERISGWQRRRL